MVSKTDREICGTCEFWTGERMPTFDKNSVPKINIVDRYGECRNCHSRFCDRTRRNDYCCKMFSKWTEIL